MARQGNGKLDVGMPAELVGWCETRPLALDARPDELRHAVQSALREAGLARPADAVTPGASTRRP